MFGTTGLLLPVASAIRAEALGRAVEELRGVVGTAFVHVDSKTREQWARSTLPRGTLPRAVVQPERPEQVQEIVRIAGRRGLPLHPISCGKNWGYSDACAATDGQIILDLRRMNRIVEVNDELAYAVIEPGVSQGQLAAYLAEHHPGLWMDATGAGPDASIVGNVLERGFGHSVNGDRFLHTCGMDVVLPDGRLLRTGFGHYANAQAAAAYKWGVGPYLDGLFTQSNLGIVTRLTFWLMPRPEHFQLLLFSVKDTEDIGGLVEALRPLRLHGTLRTPVHIFNDYRLVAGTASYPWHRLDGKAALPADILHRLQHENGLCGAWLGCAGLYGSRLEVNAAAREVKRALRRVPRCSPVVCLDERRLRWGLRLARWLGTIGAGRAWACRLEKAQTLFLLLQGQPSEHTLANSRWRCRPAHRPIDSDDPLDHNAGLLWISPVLPMTRAHVDRLQALIRPLFPQGATTHDLRATARRPLAGAFSPAPARVDDGACGRPGPPNRGQVRCHAPGVDGRLRTRGGQLPGTRL